jgi:hypothetical protein
VFVRAGWLDWYDDGRALVVGGGVRCACDIDVASAARNATLGCRIVGMVIVGVEGMNAGELGDSVTLVRRLWVCVLSGLLLQTFSLSRCNLCMSPCHTVLSFARALIWL